MLLTPPEAAERLRVSLRMVYALMADGSLVAVKIRRAKRIDEHELQRFIESCQPTSTRKRKGGAGSSRPSSTASGTDIAKAFLAAGVRLKPSDTMSKKRRGSTPVLLSVVV